MPSNGIQVAITGEITPTSISDTYPVLNPYWGLGGLRNVIDLVERDAITVSRREAGMLVFVASNGRYYKLEAGLTNLDWTDLGVSLGGSSYQNPIFATVYLTGTLADANAMGGVAKRCYGGPTGFQDAYNAANALQLTLGNQIVDIRVLNTVGTISNLGSFTSLTGNLTLTANFNSRVRIIGLGSNISVLDDIIGTNATGNGYNVPALSNLGLNIINCRLRDILTSATGSTGNSGNVSLNLINSIVRNINTSTTNLVGNGGIANVSSFNGTSTVTTIVTSSGDTTTKAGSVAISGRGLFLSNILTANNNLGGAITLPDNITVSQISSISLSPTNLTINLIAVRIGVLILGLPNQSIVNITNSTLGNIEIYNTIGAGILVTASNSLFDTITLDPSHNTQLNFSNCVVKNSGTGSLNRGLVEYTGTGSFFKDCQFISINLINSIFSDIGDNLEFINCFFNSITNQPSQVPYSIESLNNVNIKTKNCIFFKGDISTISVNVLQRDMQIPYYVASTDFLGGNFVLNPNIDEMCYVVADIDLIFYMDGNYFGSPVIGKKYTIFFENPDSGVRILDFSALSGLIPIIKGNAGAFINITYTNGQTTHDIVEYISNGTYLFIEHKPNYLT